MDWPRSGGNPARWYDTNCDWNCAVVGNELPPGYRDGSASAMTLPMISEPGRNALMLSMPGEWFAPVIAVGVDPTSSQSAGAANEKPVGRSFDVSAETA